MTDEVPDTMGVDQERAKLRGDRPAEEGPSVAKMATTYGSAFVENEDDAERIAAEQTSDAEGTGDGLGRPQSSPQGER